MTQHNIHTHSDISIPAFKPEVDVLLLPLASNEESKAEKPAILEEVVIEEVSIDGMCGVY